MKIGFIADPHVQNHKRFAEPTMGLAAPINSRARDICSIMGIARRKAEEHGCSHLFVLGDVFDTTTPTPQLIAEAQLALASLKGMEVHIIIGNHDQQSPATGDHSCVSMDGIRNLHVHEKPEEVFVDDGLTVLLNPYHPGRADEYLPGEVKGRQGKGKNVLGMHLGLRDDDTPPWLQNAHDSFPVNRLHELGPLDLVVAGNWHERKNWGEHIWQCGAIVPTGFDNPGLTGYGSLLIYDGKRLEVIELDGPRFVRTTGLAHARKVMQEMQDRATGYPVYVSIRCRLDEREQAHELFELYDHKGYEVLTDKAAAEDAARSAASAAAYASTDSIQAAVSAYVDKMALPEDIVRDEVRAKALDYVAGASQ